MVKSDLELNDNAKNIENNPQQIYRYKLRRNVIPFKYQHYTSKYQLKPNHFVSSGLVFYLIDHLIEVHIEVYFV